MAYFIRQTYDQTRFAKSTGISTTTVQKLTKNESVGIDIILRICEELNLLIDDVVEFVEE